MASVKPPDKGLRSNLAPVLASAVRVHGAACATFRTMTAPVPEWFIIGEATTGEVMRRIANSVSNLGMAAQVRSAPMLAHWFVLDTLLLANRANRDGMHANALALTRQRVESYEGDGRAAHGHDAVEAIRPEPGHGEAC